MTHPDEPIDLPMAAIERCASKEDAVLECWNHRRDRNLTHDRAAAAMGVSRPTFTRLLGGQAAFRGTQESVFQRLCGNRAIVQYQAWELGCVLVDERRENTPASVSWLHADRRSA